MNPTVNPAIAAANIHTGVDIVANAVTTGIIIGRNAKRIALNPLKYPTPSAKGNISAINAGTSIIVP